MAKLTETDVAAIHRARTITCITRSDGLGAISCKGPGIGRDVFGSALAFYGHSGEPVHTVATATRQDGAPGPKAHLMESADTDPVWQTVATSLEPGDELLLYWSWAANGTLLRLVVANAGKKATRTYLLACIPHEPLVVKDPTPTEAAEAESKPAENDKPAGPEVKQGDPAPERTLRPVVADVRRVWASAKVDHPVVTTVVLVSLGTTFALLAGLPLLHTVVAFLVLGGGTWWSRKDRSAPRASAPAPRPVVSLRGRKAA